MTCPRAPPELQAAFVHGHGRRGPLLDRERDAAEPVLELRRVGEVVAKGDDPLLERLDLSLEEPVERRAALVPGADGPGQEEQEKGRADEASRQRVRTDHGGHSEGVPSCTRVGRGALDPRPAGTEPATPRRTGSARPGTGPGRRGFAFCGGAARGGQPPGRRGPVDADPPARKRDAGMVGDPA